MYACDGWATTTTISTFYCVLMHLVSSRVFPLTPLFLVIKEMDTNLSHYDTLIWFITQLTIQDGNNESKPDGANLL